MSTLSKEARVGFDHSDTATRGVRVINHRKRSGYVWVPHDYLDSGGV